MSFHFLDIKSKNSKLDKYRDIKSMSTEPYINFKLKVSSIDRTVFGFMLDKKYFYKLIVFSNICKIPSKFVGKETLNNNFNSFLSSFVDIRPILLLIPL